MGWRDIVHPDDLWLFEPVLPLSQGRTNPQAARVPRAPP